MSGFQQSQAGVGQYHGMDATSMQLGASELPESLPDVARMSTGVDRQVAEIQATAASLIKAYAHNGPSVLAHIRAGGTAVIILPFGWLRWAVAACGLDTGFNAPSPTRGFRMLHTLAKALKLRHGNKIRQNGVVILTAQSQHLNNAAHTLHHWLAFKAGMQGYSPLAQQLYKKFWRGNGQLVTHELHTLGIHETRQLQAAINRDMEALQFVQSLINAPRQ